MPQRVIRAGQDRLCQRKVRIKIGTSWPWADQLAAAFTRLAAIRQPLIT